jgi:hypothetical protein
MLSLQMSTQIEVMPMLCDVFLLPKKKEAQKLNELKQTSKKKDQQSYAAENCCVRQEMNSEANILHNVFGLPCSWA